MSEISNRFLIQDEFRYLCMHKILLYVCVDKILLTAMRLQQELSTSGKSFGQRLLYANNLAQACFNPLRIREVFGLLAGSVILIISAVPECFADSAASRFYRRRG